MSLAARILARIDCKPTLGAVKGVRFDGLKRLGPAAELAVEYEDQGADEILLLDVVASLYGLPPAWDYLAGVAYPLTIPLAYGGGVRSVDDAVRVLLMGCEKVALNSAAVERPRLLAEIARAVGSQAVVLQLDAKRVAADGWRVYTLGGREPSLRNAVDWAREAEALGVGEILVTSVDRDGTQAGYDWPLVRAVRDAVSVPVSASGGCGSPADAVRILEMGASPAVGTWLHAGGSVGAIKAAVADAGMEVRV